MTIKETTTFLDRIKQHYQEFIIDDYKIDEWHKALKDYDNEDVNGKLDEHLKSEKYGEMIPKVYFLVKYLKTTQQKSKSLNERDIITCHICGEEMIYEKFDSHFNRCSSVNYVINKTNQWLGKKLNRESLMKMNQQEFDIKYDKLLNYIMKNTKDETEELRISYIFNPPQEVKLADIIQIN